MASHQPQKKQHPHHQPPRLLRLVRGLGHTIGLGMLSVLRGQQNRSNQKNNVEDNFKTSGYVVRADILQPSLLPDNTSFVVFRTYCDDSWCYLSLQPSRIHKWIIQLLAQEDIIQVEDAFPNSDKEEFLVVCKTPQPVRVVEIRKMTESSPEYPPVRDFTRLLQNSEPTCTTSEYSIDITPFEIGTVPLSGSRELVCLPEELQTEVVNIAIRTLQKFWYPKLLLAAQTRARRKLIEEGMKTCPPVTVDIIQRQPMFRQWPHPLLYEIVQSLTMISFSQGEIIIHED
eukprot:PhF_6_TR43404/c0_g1_i2/m.66652